MRRLPEITPEQGQRVDVTRWVHREPEYTTTGEVVTVTPNVLIIRDDAGTRWSYFRDEITVYKTWEEQ